LYRNQEVFTDTRKTTDQAQAKSSELAVRAWTGLGEALKQLVLLLMRHSAPSVGDRHPESKVQRTRVTYRCAACWQQIAEVHLGPGHVRLVFWRLGRPYSHPDLPPWRRFSELERIADEVDDDLDQAAAVAADPIDTEGIQGAVALEPEVDIVDGCLFAEHANSVVHLFPRREVGSVDHDEAGPEFRHIENI
jgi:hypothetical protein